MQIILLEKVHNLGDLGELVEVKNGYARNYLIPQQKAARATAAAKSLVEQRRRQLAEEEDKRLEVAKARAELAVREISVTRLCSEQGKLYGSVTSADIAEIITAAGAAIERSEVSLPDGSLKQIGEFEATIILHPEVRFTVKVVVEEQSPTPATPDWRDAPAKAESE